jgi:hypothetical protein
MRRPRFTLAAGLVGMLFVTAVRAHAQVPGVGLTGAGVDPFSLYYGYYLPHQAAIAAQPTPLDTINAATAARQFTAATNRSALYDPVSPYGTDEELDPLAPYGAQRGRQGGGPATPGFTTNIRGTGPALYYNRPAQYYSRSPLGTNIRTGRGANRNIATVRGARGGGMYGGGGMGVGGGMGIPGPR